MTAAAGEALDQCRRRVQQDTCGHRGRPGTRSTRPAEPCNTGAELLTDKQKTRLTGIFAIDAHVDVEATWRIYQQMITAYRNPDRAHGRTTMSTLIDALSAGAPLA